MSERGGRSFSDISLLLEASMSDAQPGSERDTLTRYKQVYAQITAENLRLQNLRDMLKEMARLGETETESLENAKMMQRSVSLKLTSWTVKHATSQAKNSNL